MVGLKGFWEENVPRGTIFGEILRRRGGNQKTTLGEEKRKGKLKTVVAPRKPAIYEKVQIEIQQRKFCRESAGNPQGRTGKK